MQEDLQCSETDKMLARRRMEDTEKALAKLDKDLKKHHEDEWEVREGD
jgi:hypothetical protein